MHAHLILLTENRSVSPTYERPLVCTTAQIDLKMSITHRNPTVGTDWPVDLIEQVFLLLFPKRRFRQSPLYGGLT
jgi:hypothetical protein